MKKYIQYICITFLFGIFCLPSYSADLAPLKLGKEPINSHFVKYNKPIYATDNLIIENSKDLPNDLDKELLYNLAFSSSETFSNPLIRLLISNDKALEDNKSYADAILRDKTHSWKNDIRFKDYYNKAKQELNSSGTISHSLLIKIKSLINEYYIIPDNTIGEQTIECIDIPQVNADNIPEKYRKAYLHIVQNWKNLLRKTPDKTKSSLIPLPNNYIVPGGRFREIYYWDSYFTIMGLNLSGLNNISKDMVGNFLYLVKQFGFVPNGNRIYYLSRSQPPFLAMMAEEVRPKVLPVKSNKEWLENVYRVITHEYRNNWMNPETHYVASIGLNRYYDAISTKRPESWGDDNAKTHNTPEFYKNERTECESGWDFSDRFQQKALNYIPVDLNSLLYEYEVLFEKWAMLLGKDDEANYWEDQADKRQQLIYKYLWNDEDGMFYDYDYVNKTQSKYKSLATVFPLWVELASKDQAKKVRDNIVNYFEFKGGVVTSLDKKHTKYQWNYPNGWPPLQLITIQSLLYYGYDSDAKRIADKWLDLNLKYYNSTGKFLEKYNVVDLTINTTGSYPNQDGFGWTNGVFLKILDTFYNEKSD